MKQWVVLSGKGGTGKTSVTAALAHLAAQERRVVLADADVDAANLELLLSPQVVEAQDFVGGKIAAIDAARCTACGCCEEVCRFGAIVSGETYRVDAMACEGCAACSYECPAGAINMLDRVSGRWFRSQTRFGPLFHARLFAGEENSGKLVAQVKQRARYLAWTMKADLLLVDGPPGTGCPAIATITGADLALLVAEPTVSGVHDLRRVLGVARHFGVPAAVCVNKADINPARTTEVEALCHEEQLAFLGAIPYDTVVTKAMVRQRAVTEYDSGSVAQALHAVWERLRAGLE